MNKAKETHKFTKSNIWIFFGALTQIPSTIFLSKYTRAFLFETNGTNINVLNLLKMTRQSTSFSTQLWGKWSLKEDKFLYYNSKPDNHRFKNLMNEPIRVSYALIYPESLQHLTDYRNPQQDQPSKITYLLMEEICALFNANHVPNMRPHWGSYNWTTETYTPNGMFSDLQHGIADIAGNTAATTYDRLKHFRFLAPTGNFNLNRLKWFFKAPPLSYTQNVWTLPFVKVLWLLIFIFVFLWFIAIAGVATWEYKNTYNETSCWCTALDIIISTLTLRGSNIVFSSYSGRLTCYCLFVLIALLNIAYNANFLVLLQSTSNAINNFKDLLNSGLSLGSLNETYNYFYFMNPNDFVNEMVRLKIQSFILKGKDQFWLNVSEGIEKVKNNAFAYHLPSTIGYNQIARTYDESTKRSIRTVNSVIRFNNYLCVPKNSTLEDFFTYGFLLLHETGIVRRVQNRLFPKRPLPDYTKAIFSSLDMNDVSFIFIIFLCGMALSVSIVILENIVSRNYCY